MTDTTKPTAFPFAEQAYDPTAAGLDLAAAYAFPRASRSNRGLPRSGANSGSILSQAGER
jgi:hypothetical protein